MSDYLGYFDGEVALGSSKLDFQTTLKTHLTVCGWQVVEEDTTNNILDVIPPSSETIGDGKVIEVTRFRIEDLKLRVYGYMKAIANWNGQTFSVITPQAGNVLASITIGGQTVTQSASSPTNTSTQNMHQLFLDLRASVLSNFLDWEFYYVPPYANQTSSGGTLAVINAYRKTITATKQSVSGSNITVNNALQGGIVSGTVQAIGCGFVDNHTSSPSAANTHDITIDLTNGFVYYMAVLSRTIYVATKCNSGFFGPLVATYVDNAEARSLVPQSKIQVAAPIEFRALVMDASGASGSTFNSIITHCFGFFEDPTIEATSAASQEVWYQQYPFDVFWVGAPPRQWLNGAMFSGAYRLVEQSNAYMGISTASGLNSLDDFPVQIIAGRGVASTNPSNSMDSVIPPCNMPDVYAAFGTTPNEGLIMIPSERVATTTTSAYDATTAYTVVDVVDTTGFPSSGGFYLNNEYWTYTAKTSTSVTGCARAQNGTIAEPSYSGDSCRPGAWFLRMNKAAIPAGFSKPV